jgi:hypothetical protein
MKNTILIAGALFVAMFTVSCKKDYTCECEKTYTSGSGTSTRDYSVYTFKDTRIRAEQRCNENTASGADLWGDYAINCAIK